LISVFRPLSDYFFTTPATTAAEPATAAFALVPQHAPQTVGQAGQHNSQLVAQSGQGSAQHAVFLALTSVVFTPQHGATTFTVVLSAQHAAWASQHAAPGSQQLFLVETDTAVVTPQQRSHTSQQASHPFAQSGQGVAQHDGVAFWSPCGCNFAPSGQLP